MKVQSLSKTIPLLLACAVLQTSTAAIAQVTFLSMSPDNARPGDLADVRFAVNGSAPAGLASVWVDGQRRCTAERSDGAFVCTMRVPFGGKLPLELRFAPPVGAPQITSQTVNISGIAIVKTQPEEPVLGRSALFFVNLEANNRLSAVQPSGSIRILDAGGLERCRIVLPTQTFCQALMLQAGRQDYTAHYSGDAQFAAITSAPFGVLTRQSLAETNLYRLADPSIPSVPELRNFSAVRNSLNRDQERLLAGDVLNPRLGNSYNLFQRIGSASSDSWYLWQSENSVITKLSEFVSERGPRDQFPLTIASTDFIASYPDRSVLILTTESLVPADNNKRADIYLRRGSDAIWVSKRADGSASNNGVNFSFSNEHGVVFTSDSPSFTADDKDALVDAFLYTETQPLRKIALGGKVADIVDIAAGSNAVLLTSTTALNSEALGDEVNAFRWASSNKQFTRVSNLEGALVSSVTSALFAPDSSVVMRLSDVKIGSSQTIWKPLLGAAIALPNTIVNLNSVRDDYTLVASSGSVLEYNLLTGASNERFIQQRGDVRILNRRVQMDASGTVIVSTSGNSEQVIDGSAQTELAHKAPGYLVSADGQQLYFTKLEALLPDDTNMTSDVYRLDRSTNTLTLLSRLPSGARPSLGVLLHQLSPQNLVFSVQASELGSSESTRVLLRLNLLNNQVSVLAPTALSCTSSTFLRSRFLIRRCSDRSIQRIEIDTNQAQTLIEGTPEFNPSIFGLDDAGAKAAVSFSFGGGSFGATASSLEYWDFTTGAKKLIETSSSDRFVGLPSQNGQFVLYLRIFASNISPPPGGLAPSTLAVYDSQTEQRRDLSVGATDFAWSDDGCKIAVTDLSVGLRTLANPFCRAPTQTAIISTTPTEPNWGQPYLVETEVTTNALSSAPTGIVRIQGFGGQCDAPLRAQGQSLLASCALIIGRNNNLPYFAGTLRANYMGDQNYSGSAARVSKTPLLQALALRLEIAPDARQPGAVRVRALLPGARPNQAIRGHVALVAGSKTAFINADQFAAGEAVSFFTEGSILTADLIDPHYFASTTVQLNPADLFASGFEGD